MGLTDNAPDKIYLCPSDSPGLDYKAEWFGFPWGDDNIEYTRTDVIIENACEFIEQNITGYIDVTHKGGDEHVTLQREFINYFKEEFIKMKDFTPKVKPKFKVGDWITDGHLHCKISDVLDDCYIIDTKFAKRSSIPFMREDNYHLWTIQDAKEGDILVASDGSLFIFAKTKDNSAYYHFSLSKNGSKEISDGKHAWETAKYCYPATKKERDLLFEEVKKAGYWWDNEKKELCKIENKEKQGEQKPFDYENANIRQKDFALKHKPKFNVGDWIYCNSVSGVRPARILNILLNRYYEIEFNDGNKYLQYIDNTDEHFHPWTIADAKDGEVLYFNDDTIVIFKDLYNSSTFHSYCHIEEGVFNISKDDMPDWWESKGFQPATKEERDLLFEKMKEEGWEWVAEKKELKRVQKQRMQKTTDKVKIKFNIGDWITDGKHTRLVIDGHSPLNYTLLEQDGNILSGTIENIQHTHHLWTIEDAKDGDVLISENDYPFIYAGNHIYTKYLTAYCGIDNDGEFKISDKTELWTNDNVKPASKEEYDLLFQKMKEVGYRWNNEKKELNKIENEEKPKWTEEDSLMIDSVIDTLKWLEGKGATNIKIDWLKSLKQRMEENEFIRKDALFEWIKHKKSFEQGFEDGEAEYGYKSALEDLFNDLKKM